MLLRVLVAYEECYRAYRTAIAQAIKHHRPHLGVRSAALGDLEEALARFDPHAVVCSRPSAEYPSGGRAAWVELPVEPTQSGDICLSGDHEGAVNPSLGKVLSVIDEAEERLRSGALAEGC